MSMQINLQHVFKMSASRTRACIGTSLAYTSDVQRDRHGVRRSFKTRLHRVVFFVEPGVKINGVYYHDVLLTQKLLPVIKQLSGNEFVFQQDSAPTHRARETIELLRRETRRTLVHWNSGHRTVHILTRWTTKYGLQCSSASTRQRFEMLTNCDSVCWTFGAAVMPVNKTSSTHPLTSGVCDSKHAYVREADILNACWKFICIDIRTSR